LEAPRLERKLVAILAADVEGYSRHMERDEAATLATLSAHRLIVDDLIASHNGRITGTAGDSVLAEFASIVDALDCAVKIQEALATANQALLDEHRLWFRIGINVGDVMVKGGDIFGDGVNIAARLESLADAGGICISRGVRDHVRKMGRYAFEDLGEQSVKNIAQPIRAFRVRAADPSQSPADQAPSEGRVLRQPALSPADAVELELAFWESIKESKDPAEYAAYLERYPAGTFAALAESRQQALQQSPSGPAIEAAAAEPEATAVELTFWESIKESKDPAEYAAYLERYPGGTFAALAESRQQALLQAPSGPAAEAAAADPEVSTVELTFWETVKDSANPEMYSAYLERYPEGAFAVLAKVRLEELR
jgi:adenylate cyclase